MDKKGRDGQPARLPNRLLMYLSPYEVWNFGPGKGYALPGLRKYSNFISALAELRTPWATELDGEVTADATEPRGWLPTLWKAPGLTFVPFVVKQPFDEIEGPVQLRRLLGEGLKQAGQSPPFTDIKKARFRVAFPVPDAAMNEDLDTEPSDPDWKADTGLRRRIGAGKRITIVAVIDDGLPFAHRNFRDASGRRTRVEFCWLQSAAFDGRNRSVLFGREYTRTQIENYIAEYGDDEDTLYRQAGATTDTEELGNMTDRHATHGAHVMDLATGYAPERGDDPAEEIRIIAVQLPNTIAWDTSGFGKDMYMLSAFHYIFHRADIIAKGYKIENPGLVINFSYGFSGGRHDGATELEAAIDQLVEKRREIGPTALVLPAGNMFLDRLHGEIRNRDFVRGKARFPWRIQPNDRTPSYLELWFRKKFKPAGYEIELWDPCGRRRGWLAVGGDSSDGSDPKRIIMLLNDKRKQIGQMSADYHRNDRWRVLIVMAPSEPEGDRLPGIEAGEWTVVIKRAGHAKRLTRPIHCWIQRDADPGTFHSGSRQSYFDDPRDVRYEDDGSLRETDTWNAFTRRFGSLNGLATAKTSLIVAGFKLGAGLGPELTEARPARYSTAGIRGKGWPLAQVACSSMSDRSNVLAGTIAAGVRSGARSFVQGTSAAAPFVARQLATAFVTAEDDAVKRAEAENYRPLLTGRKPDPNEDPLKSRLGTVRVPPHWQPGLKRPKC
jgi:hypothetical protein